MNKQTIAQVEERRQIVLARLYRAAKELQELERKLKKMRTGKLKVPPPPGVKHTIESNPNGMCADTFGDLIPSFGPR